MHAEAVRDLDSAIALEPGNAEFLALRAQVRFESGSLVDAERDLRSALRIDPLSASAYALRIQLRLKSGTSEAASDDMVRLLTVAPQSASTHFLYAAFLDATGKAQEAVRARADADTLQALARKRAVEVVNPRLRVL